MAHACLTTPVTGIASIKGILPPTSTPGRPVLTYGYACLRTYRPDLRPWGRSQRYNWPVSPSLHLLPRIGGALDGPGHVFVIIGSRERSGSHN